MPSPPFTEWRLLSQERGGPLRLTGSAEGMVLYRGATDPMNLSEISGLQGHEVRLSAMAMSSSGLLGALPPLVSVPRLLPVEVEFDVARRSDGAVAFAIEDFLGESSALDVGVVRDGPENVEAVYSDFNDYGRPRFVRGNVAPGRYLSTVIGWGYLAVLEKPPVAPADVTPKSAPFALLVEAQSGVVLSRAETPPSDVQALLAGPMALFTFTEGNSGGLTSPVGALSGTLSLRRMADGAVTGSPQVLFSENGTFGFDVDAVGRKALVLGLTETGPQLLHLDLVSGTATTVPWPSDYPATTYWAASPTMAAVPDSTRIAFAFYEGAGDSGRGIRYGEIDLAQIR